SISFGSWSGSRSGGTTNELLRERERTTAAAIRRAVLTTIFMGVEDRSLFSCFGVELEYMIVRADDLRVAPWADRVLIDAAGRPVSDVDRGPISWSNEL